MSFFRDRRSSDGPAYMLAALRTALTLTLATPLLLLGCKATPPPARPNTTSTQPQYPPRPSTSPAGFKVFHLDASSMTLVTPQNATDAEIESLIWQLHDAARTHTFDKLNIPQKLVDGRDPIFWFHIYRGTKCASEKYTSGTLPCGPSYHAAGDYTYGSFANRNRDSGVILHGEDHSTPLWNPDVSENTSSSETQSQ